MTINFTITGRIKKLFKWTYFTKSYIKTICEADNYSVLLYQNECITDFIKNNKEVKYENIIIDFLWDDEKGNNNWGNVKNVRN